VAKDPEEALELAKEVGFPLLARPSYVLGGRAMRVLRSPEELKRYLEEVYGPLQEKPSILLDRYLEGALELDVDASPTGRRS
jgi:carbamoyl-phosphate synthase large subunit